MGKTKILWIAITVPCKMTPHAGGQTFRFYFERFAESGYFNIKLIGMDDGINDSDISKSVKGVEYKIFHKNVSKIYKLANIESTFNIWNRHAGFLSNYYASSILRLAREYKREGFFPDVIILESTGVVLLAEEMRRLFPGIPLIASEHDVSYIGWERKAEYFRGMKRWIWHKKAIYEKKMELKSLSLCGLVMPHNPDNCRLLEKEGIDKSKLMALVPYFHSMSHLKRNKMNRDILFFGAMNRSENYLSAIWFIKNVMPLLEAMDVRFVVLGNDPPDKLRKFESKRVHITGYVNDIEPYFEQSLCMVAPLVLGAGIKVKVLEGLSSGIPILTNEIGIEGIPAVDEKEYFHCESAEDYADAVDRLLKGQIDTECLEKNVRSLMSRISLQDSLERFMNCTKGLAGKEV